MADESIRPEVVSQILAALVAMDTDALNAAKEEEPTPEEMEAAGNLFYTHAQLNGDRLERCLPVWEVVAPYIRRLGLGTTPMTEAFQTAAAAMTPDDLKRFVEALRRLQPGDMDYGERPSAPG